MKTKQSPMNYLLAFLVIALLGACQTILQKPPEHSSTQELKRDKYHVSIPTHDGLQIEATIFQPKLAEGESAPLILHTHGFTVWRMSGSVGLYGSLMFTGRMAEEAWRKGNYWVISYDQRGHGDTDGIIRVMDPQYEVKDISTILDWVETNLPRVAKDQDNDLLVGTIGESYGGAFQTMGSLNDTRIDAIVPITTWHDLRTSLMPNDVPMSGWLTTLIVMGDNFFNNNKMDPQLVTAYQDAKKDGVVKQSTVDYLHTHAPKPQCDNGIPPSSDALFIQGFRDNLFPMNEGIKNADCWKEAGRDVRFLAVNDGHLLPFGQFSKNGMTFWDLQEKTWCDGNKVKLKETIMSWWDEKLKGDNGAANDIPELCVSIKGKDAINLTQWPEANQTFSVKAAEVVTKRSGKYEMAFTPIDKLQTNPLKRGQKQRVMGGGIRPLFIPLTQVSEETVLAGIPKAKLTLAGEQKADDRTIVYVGVGIKKPGVKRIELIDQQLVPLAEFGQHQFDMHAISARLKKNDIVGLVVRGYSNQYRFSRSKKANKITISGEVSLPILKEAEHLLVKQ